LEFKVHASDAGADFVVLRRLTMKGNASFTPYFLPLNTRELQPLEKFQLLTLILSVKRQRHQKDAGANLTSIAYFEGLVSQAAIGENGFTYSDGVTFKGDSGAVLLVNNATEVIGMHTGVETGDSSLSDSASQETLRRGVKDALGSRDQLHWALKARVFASACPGAHVIGDAGLTAVLANNEEEKCHQLEVSSGSGEDESAEPWCQITVCDYSRVPDTARGQRRLRAGDAAARGECVGEL